MKENIEDYRKAGFINLDEYFLNNPGSFTYPYYIDGYDEKNFWTQVGKEDKEKFIYVKPREGKEAEDIYNVYAELLYQEMMKQVGIKTANFDASYYDGNVATLSENVLDDYDKNEFIINSSELLCSNRYSSDSSIEDLFNTIHDYCEYEHIDKKQEEKCYKDIQKVCIADIFLLSTDRDINDLDFIAGKDNKENEKVITEETGVVLDDSFLSEYLTAKQVNSIMKDFYKTWNENKYINLLKQFNLPTDKLIKDFSSGMRMKLKIATAISHNPKLLILDEPTSGLDPIVRNEILDIFRKYIEEDETRSILLSTHITTDLEHISDYIVFIEKGKIIFDLPTDELLENYGIIKCSREDFIRLDEKDYIAYKKGKYQYEVLTNDKSAIRSKYNISTIDKPSIEDIMLFYIKGEK